MSLFYQPEDISLLYVEDEQNSRDTLLAMMKIRFPQVRLLCAEDGQKALELFEGFRPAIIVTDICMPYMDGIDMTQKVKTIDPEVVIIATSAHSKTEYFLRAIEAGIRNFVLKPIDVEKLFAVIEEAIEHVRSKRLLRFQAAHIATLSMAVEQSPVTVIITDYKGTIEYVNPKFTQLTGYGNEEAVGHNVQFLKSGVTENSVYNDLWRTVSAGREWRGEFSNKKKNGELYWESASVSPLFNSRGDIAHYVAVKEDITARKRADSEIRELNAALTARAHELEAANSDLLAFNHMVSHDLLEPVAVIRGFAEILLNKCMNENLICRDYVHIINVEIKKMDSLIKSLIKLSRISALELAKQDVDLSLLVTMIVCDLKQRHQERRVTCRIAKGISCQGDYELLRIVMENLLGNAWKYTSRRKLAIVKFGETIQEGRRVYYVKDNGIGFDNSKAGSIFKAFTRLHDDKEFNGFGIGLATVERIIEMHGGKVWAEGGIDNGACVYFTLG